MAIHISTPSEALALLNAGYLPDYSGLSLVDADAVLTDLADAVLDIIEFTNIVIEPETLSEYLGEPEFYHHIGLEEGSVVDSAVAFGMAIADHINAVAVAEESDESSAHLLIRSLHLHLEGTVSSDFDCETDLRRVEMQLVRFDPVEDHSAHVSVFGEVTDEIIADAALALALVAFNIIRCYFADGAELDDNGQTFDAYLDAIDAL